MGKALRSVQFPKNIGGGHLLDRVWSGKGGGLRLMRTMVAKLRGKLGGDTRKPATSSPSPGWANRCR